MDLIDLIGFRVEDIAAGVWDFGDCLVEVRKPCMGFSSAYLAAVFGLQLGYTLQ